MKVKFDFNASLWIRDIVIEAKSHKEAYDKLLGMSISELLSEINDYDNGECADYDYQDIDSEIISGNYEVKVTKIVYDDFDLERKNLSLHDLPSELELEVEDTTEDDLESEIDYIFMQKYDITPEKYEIEIISEPGVSK